MPTSGPIVRTGATPEFWKNWENIFGGKKKAGGKPAAARPAGRKSAAKKAAAKPSPKKKSKAAGKK
jgi:hypothetical protein